MNLKPPVLFVLSATTLLATAIGAGAAHPRQPQQPVKVDPAVMAKSVGEMTADEEQQFSDAAEATIQRVCILCHPFENIVKTRRTVREWNEQITVMKGRGAPGTDPDFATVRKYLSRYYGIVRVNSAPAEELTSVLGLSPKAANAVVEYRTAHGKIPDLETFLKIDGIDKARIEEQPEALRFN